MNKDNIIKIITENAETWEINPALALAIAEHESALNPSAEALTGGDAARGGSYGLMQMSLQTAKGLGYHGDGPGLLDPGTNAFFGCKYLHMLTKRAGYGIDDVICAYNSGRPAAKAPTVTTASYLPDVLKKYSNWSNLLRAQSSAAPGVNSAQPQ